MIKKIFLFGIVIIFGITFIFLNCSKSKKQKKQEKITTKIINVPQDSLQEKKNNIIRIVTEEYPPYNYTENGKVTGCSTEIVNEVLKRLGMNVKIEVYPWARSYQYAQNIENVLIYSIKKTPQRAGLFKWVGKIAPRELWIFKLKDRQDIKIKKFDDLKKYLVSALIENASTHELINKGFKKSKNLDLVSSHAIMIKKLFKKRADLVPFNPLELLYRINKIRKEKDELFQNIKYSDCEKVFLLTEKGEQYYMAFSKKTPDEIVKKFRNTLNEVRIDGTIDKILSNYLK